MVSQTVDGEEHWAIIKLADVRESSDKRNIFGTWRHTNKSYNDEEIQFTSDHSQYLKWRWEGGPQGGKLYVGSIMGRASHREDERTIETVYLTFDSVRRQANGAWLFASQDDDGHGKFANNTEPHFKKGDFLWTVVRYER